MHRLALEVMFAAIASLWLAGCASWSSAPPAAPTVARSAAPTRYEATVNNYFDLTMPAQTTPRKLTIGAPEGSPCALHGTGGRHAGWMVPVIYDTTPPPQPVASTPTPPRTAASTKGGNDKGSKAAVTQPLKSSTSGTATATATATANNSSAPANALKEVNVRGTRYFFWFSSETLAAVSRDADTCP